MYELLTITLLGALLILGVHFMRQYNHHRHDQQRNYFRVFYPPDFKLDQVSAFLHALHGLRKLKPVNLPHDVPPSLTFEIEASREKGLQFALSVPKTHSKFVTGQLAGHIPGARWEEAEPEDKTWTHCIEVATTSHHKPLEIPDATRQITTILTSMMAHLKDEEAVLAQWIIAAAKDDSQTSKDGHTYFAVCRIAAKAQNLESARGLIGHVFMAYCSLGSSKVTFKEQRVTPRRVQQRVMERSTPLSYTSRLDVDELATVLALPAGAPSVPGLPQGRARSLQPDPSIPSDGFVVGKANFQGMVRPLAIPHEARLMHLHISGTSGMGKTSLIQNLIFQEMLKGYGLALFDVDGDIFDAVLDTIPEHRFGDLVVFDFTDLATTVGYNVMEGDDPHATAGRVFAVLDGLYGMTGKMPRTADVFNNALLTLATAGLAFADLPVLLESGANGKAFREQAVQKLNNPITKRFWQGYDSLKDAEQRQWTDPLMTRINPMLTRPNVRAALGQINPKFSMIDAVNQNKILLFKAAEGLLDHGAAQLLAALYLTPLWQAILGRISIDEADRKPFFLHLDEFYKYAHLPMGLDTMLYNARKYGLGVTLAHQALSQLNPQMRSAIQQASTQVHFRATMDDSSTLVRNMSQYHLNPHELGSLARFEAVLRIQGGPPATINTEPPPMRLGSARAARKASHEAYGVPVSVVETEIEARQRMARKPTERPNIEWEEEGDGDATP